MRKCAGFSLMDSMGGGIYIFIYELNSQINSYILYLNY